MSNWRMFRGLTLAWAMMYAVLTTTTICVLVGAGVALRLLEQYCYKPWDVAGEVLYGEPWYRQLGFTCGAAVTLTALTCAGGIWLQRRSQRSFSAVAPSIALLVLCVVLCVVSVSVFRCVYPLLVVLPRSGP
jgi:hypothetical protein